MKLGLTKKLLLALLGANVLLVAVMTVSTQWSFQRGFVNYLQQSELNELQPVAKALIATYREQGNWDFVRRRRLVWQQYLRELPGESARLPVWPPPPRGAAAGTARGVAGQQGGRAQAGGWQRTGEYPPPPGYPPQPFGFSADAPVNGRPPPPPPGAKSGIGGRLRLLEAGGRIVVGPPDDSGKPLFLPLTLDGKVIGKLSLTPLKLAGEGLERRFRDQQRTALWLAAASALLLSLLVAIPLGRYLLSPIKRLTRGARELAAGRYATRIPEGSRDELGELGRDFNLLAEALERNEQLRRQSMADVSHELRTPLSVLRAELEALQDGVRSWDDSRLSSLHTGVLGLSRLVDDLYELALSDAGALSYQKEPFDATVLLEEVLDDGEEMLRQKGIGLERRLDSDVPMLADPRRLRQVFHNLLKNSARYTDAGGRVEVSCRRVGGVAHIDYQDSAPGVPEELLPRLFERFYRVEASRNRARGGAGLGLAICRNIVEAHGGEITARPSPLGGLWVHIVLPLREQT